MKTFKICIPILLFILSLLLASCGNGKDDASATTMRLRKTEGKVRINDAQDKDIEAREDLALYSGYGLKTKTESFAWVDLDSVKLAKLDESSKIEIEKDGDDLTILLRDGNIFFQITEPLGDDESMSIRTSSMMIGIRGTCGWIETEKSGDVTKIYLLEGKVKCRAGEESVTVTAGEMAMIGEDSGLIVETFSADAIPPFVSDEAKDNDDLNKMMQELSSQGGENTPDGTAEGNTPAESSAEAPVAEQLLPFSQPLINFVFASGAGAWSTSLTLNSDGTFSGSYHDSNMGETGPGYDGSVYVCNFEGKFTDILQVDDFTYTMKLESCDYETPEGEEWIENQVRYVASGAYGIEGGDTFELYLPGKPVESLPDEFIGWSRGLTEDYIPQENGMPLVSTLQTYGLYNVNEGNGFFQY